MAGQLPLLIHSLLHLSNMWLLSSYYVPALLISQSANRRTEVSPMFNVKVIVRGAERD